MIRWSIAPLIAAVVLAGSGFTRSLTETSVLSARMAEASRAAPRSTAAAAEEVGVMPLLADLTTQQAAAFDGLARALELSAQRVEQLNGTLDRQVEGLGDLTGALGSLDAPLDCVERNLRSLSRSSSAVPGSLREIESSLERIVAAQGKSLRHLRSINRKLAALGVAADAAGIEAPPPPRGTTPPPIPKPFSANKPTCGVG